VVGSTLFWVTPFRDETPSEHGPGSAVAAPFHLDETEEPEQADALSGAALVTMMQSADLWNRNDWPEFR
jgi:hypothetical protein